MLANLVLDDLGEILAAENAMIVLEARLNTWCSKPYVSRDDIESLGMLHRAIRAGLQAGRGKRIAELKKLEKGVQNE